MGKDAIFSTIEKKKRPSPAYKLRRTRGRRGDSEVEYDDDDDDEEEKQRREKKMRFVVKIPKSYRNDRRKCSYVEKKVDLNSEEYKPFKKRKMGSDEEREVHAIRSGNRKENKQNENSKVMDPIPGNLIGTQIRFPLPDIKMLEATLAKLQKKDIYGVYAEPVDPEELPDYHDIIEHPMDFSTIRKKLSSGAYSNLDQFESDIYLICSNAMKYNAPDTIYFKQARSIKELAGKKFQNLRSKSESVEPISIWKTRTDPTTRPPVKPSLETFHKPVRSDFSSGPTLANVMDSNNCSNEPISIWKTRTDPTTRPPVKPSLETFHEPVRSEFSSDTTLANVMDSNNCSNKEQSDVIEELENNVSIEDNNEDKLEKLEDLSEKDIPVRPVKKHSLDENRRTTYNPCSPSLSKIESAFTIFESDTKELMSVGPLSDYSYARSLSRFAANLSPTVWDIASKRIEQALPLGCKFGPGWVGEYEPIHTPLLFFARSDPIKLHSVNEVRYNSTASKDFNNDRVSDRSNVKLVPETHPRSFPMPVSITAPVLSLHAKLESEKKNGDEACVNFGRSFDRLPTGFTGGNEIQRLKERCTISINSKGNNCSLGIASKRDIEPGNNPVKIGEIYSGHTSPLVLNSSQVRFPFLSSPGHDSDAANLAARAWMSVGALQPKSKESLGSTKMPITVASLYDPIRGFTYKMPQSIKNVNGESPFAKREGGTSKFEIQVPWDDLIPCLRQKSKMDMRAPDLNIGFMSPESSVRVDSQQPDLALQL